jgi:hypothetical protein
MKKHLTLLTLQDLRQELHQIVQLVNLRVAMGIGIREEDTRLRPVMGAEMIRTSDQK